MSGERENYSLRADEVAQLDPYKVRGNKDLEPAEEVAQEKYEPDPKPIYREVPYIPADQPDFTQTPLRVKTLRFIEYSSAAAVILDLQLFALTRGESGFGGEQILGAFVGIFIFMLAKAGADKYENDL